MADPQTLTVNGETTRAILEKRAHTLARPLPIEDEAGTIEMVVMVLGPERYGVEMQHVREVVELSDLAPVPGVPSFWIGIVNLRGTLYPVLDLCRYLGLPDEERAERPATVVLISGAGLTIGIAVDDSPEVRRVPAAAIRPPLAGIPEAARTAVRGVTDDLLTILDVEALLGDPALVVREEAL